MNITHDNKYNETQKMPLLNNSINYDNTLEKLSKSSDNHMLIQNKKLDTIVNIINNTLNTNEKIPATMELLVDNNVESCKKTSDILYKFNELENKLDELLITCKAIDKSITNINLKLSQYEIDE
jgi:hypothetical protein